LIRGLGRDSFVWVVRRSCRQERDGYLWTARGCALGMEVVANRARACGRLRRRWISQSCRNMSVGVGRGFRRFAAGIATGFSAGVSRRRVGFAVDGGVRGVRVGRIAAAAPCGWRRVGSWCRALRDGGSWGALACAECSWRSQHSRPAGWRLGLSRTARGRAERRGGVFSTRRWMALVSAARAGFAVFAPCAMAAGRRMGFSRTARGRAERTGGGVFGMRR
jgi:hypothetical protein